MTADTTPVETPTKGGVIAADGLFIPDHGSYSQSNTLSTCSYQWYLGRGRRVPEIPSWGSTGGNAVHKATEEHDRELFNGNTWTDTECREAFHQYLTDEINDRQERSGRDKAEFYAGGRASKQYPNKEGEDWWRDNGPAMVLRWKSWMQVTPWELAVLSDENGEAFPAVEVPVEGDFGGVHVVGYVDRFFTYQDHTICLDIKSNARVPDEPKQLGLYGVMATPWFGEPVRLGAYWMARTGASTELKDLSVFTPERFAYEFAAGQRIIDERAFVPKVSSLCKGCGVRESCYAFSATREALELAPWNQG